MYINNLNTHDNIPEISATAMFPTFGYLKL